MANLVFSLYFQFLFQQSSKKVHQFTHQNNIGRPFQRSLSSSSTHFSIGGNGNNTASSGTTTRVSVNNFLDNASSNVNATKKNLFSVAPMMEYTYEHQQRFQRLLSKQAVLYTEMVGVSSIVHAKDKSDLDRHLLGYVNDLDLPDRQKVVLQFGGSNIDDMKKATKIAVEQYGYEEININCGCPSEKVAGDGCFGAALMLNPSLICQLVDTVTDVTGKPATIKCRIGVNNDFDTYEQLYEFIEYISNKSGVKHFIIHARKALLGAKFSPADNRKIPPLKYDYVYRLVQDFPHLFFTLNGGVTDYPDIAVHIDENKVHGVMVGRSAVEDPWKWRFIDSKIYGVTDSGLTRRMILEQYAVYALQQEKIDRRARRSLIKPVLNLFLGEYNGRMFRQRIDTYLKDPKLYAGDLLVAASECIPSHVLDSFLETSPIKSSSFMTNNDKSSNSSDSHGNIYVSKSNISSALNDS